MPMMMHHIVLFLGILRTCMNEDVGWHKLACISSDEVVSGSLWMTVTNDRASCLWECYRSPRCKSFAYNRFDRHCRGYRNYINDDLQDSHDTDHEWYTIEYYNMWPDLVLPKVGGTGLVGSTCEQDRDCDVEGSQCYQNTCSCNFGYTNDGSDMSCVTSCQIYGSNFTVYPEIMVNVESTYSSGQIVNAPEKCKDECIRSTDGVCVIALAMPYTGGDFYCNFGSETSTAAAFVYKQLATVYVRHCA